eukprot:scaffold124827_cov63-Phaeocystis_antarctica.AAC.4
MSASATSATGREHGSQSARAYEQRPARALSRGPRRVRGPWRHRRSGVSRDCDPRPAAEEGERAREEVALARRAALGDLVRIGAGVRVGVRVTAWVWVWVWVGVERHSTTSAPTLSPWLVSVSHAAARALSTSAHSTSCPSTQSVGKDESFDHLATVKSVHAHPATQPSVPSRITSIWHSAGASERPPQTRNSWGRARSRLRWATEATARSAPPEVIVKE